MSLKSFLHNKRVQKGGAITVGIAGALVAAAMIAPASGAYFSATGAGTANVGTATLGLDFGDNSSQTFNVNFENVKPGDRVYKTFRVNNRGTIPADVSFHARDLKVEGGNNPNLRLLSYHVEGFNPPKVVATQDDPTISLGTLAPGANWTYELYIELDKDAGNEWQGVKAVSNLDIRLDQQR